MSLNSVVASAVTLSSGKIVKSVAAAGWELINPEKNRKKINKFILIFLNKDD